MNRAERRKLAKSKTEELRKVARSAGARGPKVKAVVRTLKKKVREAA